MKKILLLVVVVILLSVVCLKHMLFAAGNLMEKTIVQINKGSSSAMVANKLAETEVIKYPLLFKLAARIQGLDKHLKAGEYVFEPKVSLMQVLEKMNRGEVFYRKITLPEGLTTTQMLDIITNNEFLSGDITIAPEEGTIMPETYSFVRGDSKDSIIKQAQIAMNNSLNDIWENRDVSVPVKNKQELLILASIIEKETGLEEERNLVASVFVNRLRKGMRLQTDPTVIYALTNGKKELDRLLTRKDLQIDSPYNTYKYYGLPPKPICNPGKKAIEAAANPEVSDYLYFVANGDGGHNFAKSLKQHNTNVSNWKKQNKGKNK